MEKQEDITSAHHVALIENTVFQMMNIYFIKGNNQSKPFWTYVKK